MVQEQRVSVSEKDNKFGDGFPKTKEDASRELKKREMVGFWRFSKNDGVPRYASGNQTATARPVTPIVYGNAAKPNVSHSTVDDSDDEMNEWKNSIRQRACDSTDAGRIFNNRTHWNMRCKFLEVGLRIKGMDEIRENPDQIYEKPEGKFFIYVRRKRNEKKGNEEAKSNGSRPADHVRKCSQSASSKSKVFLKVQNVISTGNAKNMFIHQNEMNKDCIKEGKTNSFKPYDCVTNGSQGDSTTKNQSIESNFSPKKKDIEDAKTNGFKSYDCVTNRSEGDSTMKNQSIESNFCPKKKDVEDVEIKKERREKRKMSNNIENVEMKKKILQEKQHSKSETCNELDELVLEDIGDKDLVLPEVAFASPQRLTCSVEHAAGNEEMLCALSVRQRDVFQNDRYPIVEGSATKVRVSLSRLERLRRRIANFFGRFRRNRVTPVDI